MVDQVIIVIPAPRLLEVCLHGAQVLAAGRWNNELGGLLS